jgi:hypothetical protein
MKLSRIPLGIKKIPLISLEIAILLLYFLFLILFFLGSTQIKNTEYIPVVITACTTFTGVLSGFIGVWINHIYQSLKSQETKNWLSKRIAFIMLGIGFSLFLELASFSNIIFDAPKDAVNYALTSADLLFFVAAEVLVLTFYRNYITEDLEKASNIQD